MSHVTLMPSWLDSPWRLRRLVGLVVAVHLAYYAGAQLGLLFRLPGATPSVLWPPNAILTSALLIIPPRYWAVVLLGALPAHLLLQVQTQWSTTLAVLLFLTNCSEALIGALSLRALSDAPTRFDSLTRVLAFLVSCVFLAPFLSSFLDAAVVTAVRGEAYWPVWQTRFFANMVTELTVVPALVIACTRLPAWVESAARGCWVEAGLLGAGLVSVSSVLSLWPDAAQSLIPGTARVPLTFLMPFVAWAAIRFGSAGASLTLLTTTVLVIRATAIGLGPFQNLSPAQTLISLQVTLVAVSAPMLVLAAVIEERHAALSALGLRLRFEELLSQLSQAFVHVSGDGMTATYREWLARVGWHFQLEGLLLLRRTEPPEALRLASGWFEHGLGDVAALVPHVDFPWAVTEVLALRPVVIRRLTDFPAEAERDRESFTRYGFRSGIGLPLIAGQEVVGVLAYFTITESTTWPSDLVARLGLVTGVFANAMAREQRDEALRASEALKSAILSSLTSGVAVLDRGGRIIDVNEQWTGLGCRSGLDCTCQPRGGNLLAACRDDVADDPRSREVLSGIERVLSGTLAEFIYPHAKAEADGPRHWVLSVRPLHHPGGGAVVTHNEITERKRAELEAQAARTQLAHMSRVATMGELTASIAHELNQPLAAIVANARAARRQMSHAQGAGTGDVIEILNDIAADGMRAGAVIERTRGMLRNGTPSRVLVDVSALVRDVAALVANDALIRNVRLELSLPVAPAIVEADPIQLQQVVLNLLMNAFESMSLEGGQRRQVQVQVASTGHASVEIAVCDTGTGMSMDGDHIFDAFYTTKPQGMGMGLSVARSIVEAHGGQILARNNQDGGATVEFSLPRAGEPVA